MLYIFIYIYYIYIYTYIYIRHLSSIYILYLCEWSRQFPSHNPLRFSPEQKSTARIEAMPKCGGYLKTFLDILELCKEV